MDLDPNTILRERIDREMEKRGPKYFFPTPRLGKVLEERHIKETLQGVLPGREQDVSELTEFVTTKAYPIFAGLVMMGKPWLITSFHRSGFGQKNLPIRYTLDEDNRFDFMSGESVGGNEINAMFRSANPAWDEQDIERFCNDMQWQFTAPIFEKANFTHEFEAGTVLPFTTRPEEVASGGYGRVDKVTIHRDHIDHTTLPLRQRSCLGETSHPVIAVKTLQGGTADQRKKDAEKEAHSLEAVRKLNNDNLIKAIAYCRIGRTHCFLFPLAEYGNLWGFWAARKKKRDEGQSHRGDNDFLVWVFTQLVGVAGALVELHEVLNIRHGDLKPENILCFQDGSCAETQDASNLAHPPIRLVVTDVGIAKRHQDTTRQRAVTSTVVSTTRYQPPEMDQTREASNNSTLSRRYDVWSLGCILFEFLIWLLYDLEGLLEFTNSFEGVEGRFYKSEKKGARIHPTVSDWIKKIKNDKRNCREGSPFRDLVNLIEEKLLVVKVETLPGTLSEVTVVENQATQLLRKLREALRKTQQATDKIAEIVRRRRASAREMRDELEKILENIKQQRFEIKRESH